MTSPRPDRRAALAEAEHAVQIAAAALAAAREALAQARAEDDAPAAAKPGKLLPIAEAAKLARCSVDTARRRAREAGRRDKNGALLIDPADLAPRSYRRPGRD